MKFILNLTADSHKSRASADLVIEVFDDEVRLSLTDENREVSVNKSEFIRILRAYA